jgi:hypothetical protein
MYYPKLHPWGEYVVAQLQERGMFGNTRPAVFRGIVSSYLVDMAEDRFTKEGDFTQGLETILRKRAERIESSPGRITRALVYQWITDHEPQLRSMGLSQESFTANGTPRLRLIKS